LFEPSIEARRCEGEAALLRSVALVSNLYTVTAARERVSQNLEDAAYRLEGRREAGGTTVLLYRKVEPQ
jgi:hypothetical protein